MACYLAHLFTFFSSTLIMIVIRSFFSYSGHPKSGNRSPIFFMGNWEFLIREHPSMFKILSLALLFGTIFWAGYYVGQQPPGEVKHKIRTMSEDMVERALGLDENRLVLQREFLEAKSRIVQSKANLIDGEFEQAANEMEHALIHLKKAFTTDDGSPSPARTNQLVVKVEELRDALASGQIIPRNAIDEVQVSLDKFLVE